MDTADPGQRVGALVALKPVEQAKSRFDTVAPPLRRRLAWTMALDTLQALAGAVDLILVVSDQPSLESRLHRAGIGVRVLPEARSQAHRGGINAALGHGFTALVGNGYTSVLASVGDLPALRSESVRRIVAASRAHPRSFVADASGLGTTMLITHGGDLDPHFQGRSAAAHHHSGAVALRDFAPGDTVLDPSVRQSGVSDARRDVDTEVDLADAFRLGLGPATARLVEPQTGRLGRYQPITVADLTASDRRNVITAEGRRLLLPPGAVDPELRRLHPGQRLHAVTFGAVVAAAWL